MNDRAKPLPSGRDQPYPLGARALMAFGRLYARVYHRLDVLAPCQIPQTGPAILVSNHTSGLDPLLLQSVCPRLIIWMMAKEYYEVAALRWGFELIQAIPVERTGKDLSSTRAALRALQAGRVLGVFPEGRIERDRNIIPFHTGVAMMARRTGAPVYPAYIDGSQRNVEMPLDFAQSQSATLTFGPRVEIQFDAPDMTLEAGTARIQAAVEKLACAASSLHAAK